ncbi:hypothetical protein Gotri_007484 [Gossypium trilobum]|uniref:Uncharacterized protein n=1 Tax=Gossypium trilobum TaxID=34281 RepID=A0A7J9EHT4_9ROSI|nr:hypothetical protein [Gossypium trilobum]
MMFSTLTVMTIVLPKILQTYMMEISKSLELGTILMN